ncbi:MAG: hypothetical protein LQ350_006727 [Teloschistes chrysophthalmus]|nr:MAG: hypothetical protein LQ350_006727 [Niorma chrysophthalma]
MDVAAQLDLVEYMRKLLLNCRGPVESSSSGRALIPPQPTKYHIQFQAGVSENEATHVRAVIDRAQKILPPIAFWSLLRDGLIDSIPPAVQHLGTLKFEVQPEERVTKREALDEIDYCRYKIEKLAYRLVLEPVDSLDLAMEFMMYFQWDEQKQILREKAKKWAEDINKMQIDPIRGKVILDKSIGPKEETEGNK